MLIIVLIELYIQPMYKECLKVKLSHVLKRQFNAQKLIIDLINACARS